MKDMDNREEFTLTKAIADKAYKTIKELQGLQKERAPQEKELSEILTEKQNLWDNYKKKLEPEKEERMLELQKTLLSLPVWPHFADLQDYAYYNPAKREITTIAILSILRAEAKVSAMIKDINFGKKKLPKYQEEKLHEKKELIEQLKVSTLQCCVENVTNPRDIYMIIETVFQNFKTATIPLLDIANYFFSRLHEQIAQSHQKLHIEEMIKILKEEEAEAIQRKKPYDSNQITALQNELQALINTSNFTAVPISSLTDLDELCHAMIELILNTSFDVIAELSKEIEAEGTKKEEIESLKREKQEIEEKVVYLSLSNVKDPDKCLHFIQNLDDRKMFEIVHQFGDKCLRILRDLTADQTETKKNSERRLELLKQKEVLDRQMKEMTKEDALHLRELIHSERMGEHLPHYRKEDKSLSTILLSLTKTWIESVARNEKCFEESIKANNDISKEEVEAQKDALKNNSALVLDKCLVQFSDITNFIELAKHLSEKKQFHLVIIVGRKAEEAIGRMMSDIEQKEDLENRNTELEQQILLFTFSASTGQFSKEELEEEKVTVQQKISQFPSFPFSIAELKDFNLELAEIMKTAARMEGATDILREQAIRSFKNNVTTERWDEVRGLCSFEEWAEIKKELVGYVLKQEDTDAQSKIQLLMKDELWVECITIFPYPRGEEGELAVLLDLYTQIEKNQPELLDKLLPVVSRYMKRYYQEFKFSEMDDLIDRVQLRYPAVMCALLSKAADMMMLNILPSQYASFVQCLKKFKDRIVHKLKRQEDWDHFFKEFQKKHKGKRRLMQMLNLIGDSSWDLSAFQAKRKRIKSEDAPTPKKKTKKETQTNE